MIWNKLKLIIPWNWTCVSNAQVIVVKWDEDKTKIEKAKLAISVLTSPGGNNSTLKLNLNEVVRHELGEERKESITDAVGFLENGSNEFSITFCKNVFNVNTVTCEVSATLEVTYSGETPKVEPPIPVWLVPAAIAGTIIGGIVTIGSVIRGRKKK